MSTIKELLVCCAHPYYHVLGSVGLEECLVNLMRKACYSAVYMVPFI